MKRTIVYLLSLSTFAFSAFANDDATPTPPDNSGTNVRDRSGETQTSGDQSNNKADIETTAAIRRAIMHDNSLSTTAKNVKIITADGVVTLRGPVMTDAEKAAIQKDAMGAAGQAKIDNQIEVKAAK